MGKKIVIVVLVIALIILGVVFLTGEREKVDVLEESRVIAEEWIVESAPTYVFDGFDLTLVESEEVEEDLYRFVFSFVSAAAGYGDRTDEMVAQVVTPHEIEVLVRDGEVISAVTDGVYDEIHEVMIDEELVEETVTISLYFLQVVGDQEELVEVLREIPSTEAIARATIEELLKGPSFEEEAQGISSAIPENTELNSIDIQNGLASVDFNEKLQEGVAGSAWVMAIRNQIEETLMQFETVDEVLILIEGESEEILQP